MCRPASQRANIEGWTAQRELECRVIDLGVMRQHNYIRAMAIEIAWGWLRYQPESELTKWYEKNFGHGSKRIRKIGIVALARKLMIALWRYLETGAIPEGAVLKSRLI